MSAPDPHTRVAKARPVARRIDQFFRRLSPRTQIALSQLPLSLVIAAIVIASPALWPHLLVHAGFVASLAIHAGLFTACLFLPWERWGPNASLVIPVADLAAIALTRNFALDTIPGLGVLAIFPVIWLAASDLRPLAGSLISFFGPLLIVLPSSLVGFPNIPPGALTSTFMLPLMMLTIWAAIRFASSTARLQQRRFEETDAELRSLLLESNDRERLLQAIIDTIEVGIAAVDKDGKYILANSQLHSFYEEAAGEPLPLGADGQPRAVDNEASSPSTPALSLWTQDGRRPLPAAKYPMNRAMGGESFADYLVWLGTGAAQRALSTAARPMRNPDGTFGGAVVVYTDVTNLMEAMAAKEDFVSNVSHELRTPLTSILGNVDLVLEEDPGLSTDSTDRLEIVQRNAERLLELVSDLLFAASAAMTVHPRRTDLASLVESTINSAQVHARSAGIRLEQNLPAPLWAYADPVRIIQVMDNLLSNAIKYSPEGGTVEVTAAEEPTQVCLKVRDRGMGMDPADAKQVFTRFFRSGAAREASIPGVGLGLSITKTIVESHGGSIDCSSALGEGTTFTVVLPLDGGVIPLLEQDSANHA